MENDLGFIKIPIERFRELYDKMDNIELNENLERKMQDLSNNYNCFSSNYDAKSLWEKKKIMAQKKTYKYGNNITRHKPRIILIDFSDEMKCKKEFISYLNKLTDVNKEVIYDKIRNLIKIIDKSIINNLFDVLINFIKNSSNHIYIDVLYLFDNDFIKNNINKYLHNYFILREWIPKEIIIENKILYHNDNYDKYCQYVKLKKHSISILKALIFICKKNGDIQILNTLFQEIINDLREYADKTEYKHIIELLLDELLIFIEIYNISNESLNEYIKSIDLHKYDYSTKFKFMKLHQ
jgi:hypothetical protein